MKTESTVRRQRGATLVEVLNSIVVTSVGLLGLAGLMVTTIRANQSAFQRTQLGLAAQALIESMHVNPVAVSQGRYNVGPQGDAAASVDCRRQACAASVRAAYDLAQFHHALDDVLPNAQASVRCKSSAGAAGSTEGGYDGICRIEVDWSERTLAAGGEPSPQSLVWVFQP